jgi:hypothetical protein
VLINKAELDLFIIVVVRMVAILEEKPPTCLRQQQDAMRIYNEHSDDDMQKVVLDCFRRVMRVLLRFEKDAT